MYMILDIDTIYYFLSLDSNHFVAIGN